MNHVDRHRQHRAFGNDKVKVRRARQRLGERNTDGFGCLRFFVSWRCKVGRGIEIPDGGFLAQVDAYEEFP